ncbi:putative addiction module antidote protein [Roseiarcus fermentans]|uniref:Putative addiction module antidote protein n=1 Tax=Roseiarcus fermentans TaxID=1473586 RepID=A0A366FE23_9HYPH|nr:addiction module antidote protein [Roseiarcus fermentans]RBP12932.1 putative addiction module antidote protein [Roseiarcus fermentans]
MNTIFIGGSRHISRLPAEVKKRLDNVIASRHQVIVGDANGADKAVQKHFLDAKYSNVTVFCSGDHPRNNLGSWITHRVDVPKETKGFQFYAAKDREMAREADFGLMIWDGKSPGTVLNVLRMVQAGKISVLFNVPDKAAVNVKTVDQYRDFIRQRDPAFRADLRERATSQEWSLIEADPEPSLPDHASVSGTDVSNAPAVASPPPTDETVRALNAALASGDAARILDALGAIARDRGMSQIARETGLARESLYRSLDAGGNPEFMTVMKVLTSLGVRLEAKPHDLSAPEHAAAE